MPLPTLTELFGIEVSEGFDTPVPIGFYDGVITKGDVKPGAKGPYLSLEVTIHGDDEFKGRKVWRNSSFSEKAIGMPGGIANLVQATQPAIDRATAANELPAAIAAAVTTMAVRIEVEHEQVVRNGVAAYNGDGTPEMRATIKSFMPPSAEFIAAVEALGAGVDGDLPF